MNIAVVFLTYAKDTKSARHLYAQKSLLSLIQKLSFRGGELRYFIADDGSGPGHVETLLKILEDYHITPLGHSNSNHKGYGGNYNAATQIVHGWADAVLAVEDDWELVRSFDLSDLSRAFNHEIQCIRLGYLGWTNPIGGSLVQSAGQTFLRFDPSCIENHVFAGHPRLETVDFEKRLGPWPEGLQAGFTEMEVCHRLESRVGVAWPLDAGVNASQDYCNTFAHIGEEHA